MNTPEAAPVARDERGFGMIEIVVAMMLLGLLAVSFLPMLVQSLRVSVSNTTLATATGLAAEQMELLRGQATSCGALQAFVARTPEPFVHKGRTLQPTLSSGACAVNTAVRVTVVVRDVEAAKNLAEATTLFFADRA